MTCSRGRRRCHRRDEPVPAPRDRLDIGRLRRVVAERLPQLRDRLRERVVGHGHVGPERLEEILLRDERRLARDEVEKEVDDLGRQLDDLGVAEQPVRRGIERVGSEAIGHRRPPSTLLHAIDHDGTMTRWSR